MFWTLLFAVEAPVTDPSAAALYAAVSAVCVALIGGAVTIAVTRSRPTPAPPSRDEPTTYALPREMADMLVEVLAERDVWRNRALRLGWNEEDAG